MKVKLHLFDLECFDGSWFFLVVLGGQMTAFGGFRWFQWPTPHAVLTPPLLSDCFLHLFSLSLLLLSLSLTKEGSMFVT